MICHGNADDHCCYLGLDGVCKYLEENTVPGRRWVCGLMRKLGSWDAVLASDEYQRDLQPFYDRYGDGTSSCRDWPDPAKGQKCKTCGANC